MLKKLLNLSLILMIVFFGSCKKSGEDDPDEWTKGSSFEGTPRSGASSFVIDNITYIAGGFDGEKRLNDIWYYSSTGTNWHVAGAAFPGKARNYAMGFSINGKGYLGGGFDGTNALSDFYEFDPVQKQWKAIADLPGGGRYGGVAFSQDGKGYVGTGTGNDKSDLKDFYSYNPANNTWVQVSSLPGDKRAYAFTFTIGETVYVGSGRNNGLYLTDFWSYNAKADKWNILKDLNNTEKSNEYNLGRENAATFVIDNKGYIIGGTSGSVLSNTWQYNPANDSWKKYQDFKGYARESAIGFAIGDHGYISTGRNGSSRFDDTWIFKPTN